MSSRVQSALAKALQYKARGEAGGVPVAEVRASAVRLVHVDGKTIGGVDFSRVDASAALAGESRYVQAGRPVTSARTFPPAEDAAASSSASVAAGEADSIADLAARVPALAAHDAGGDAAAGPFASGLLLALRSKQAAATAALAHAAATAAMPAPAHAGRRATDGETEAVAAARDRAQRAVEEFEDARLRLQQCIAARTGVSADAILWA